MSVLLLKLFPGISVAQHDGVLLQCQLLQDDPETIDAPAVGTDRLRLGRGCCAAASTQSQKPQKPHPYEAWIDSPANPDVHVSMALERLNHPHLSPALQGWILEDGCSIPRFWPIVCPTLPMPGAGESTVRTVVPTRDRLPLWTPRHTVQDRHIGLIVNDQLIIAVGHEIFVYGIRRNSDACPSRPVIHACNLST